MKITNLALSSLILAFAAPAGAQPIGDPEGTPAPPPAPAPPPVQTTTTVVTTTATAPPAPRFEPALDTSLRDARPEGFSIAIGAGYVLPTSLEIPNTTSVRFRFSNGLTIEPNLVFATTTQSVDTGMTISQDTTDVGIGGVVRFPVMHRRNVDLEILGNVAVDSTDVDPPSDNNTTTTTNMSLGYGVGISYWLSPHWNLSLSAQNPIVQFSKERVEMGPDTVTVNSLTTFGAIFHPTVTVMIHLYN